jgi:hypothetical protein
MGAGKLVVAFAVILAVLLVSLAMATGPGGWDHLGDAGTPGTDALNGTVSDLYVAGPGALYAGGTFTSAGGNTAAAYVAKWDGTSWGPAAAPILGGSVDAIAVAGGKLYVGGTFTNAGGNVDADHLAVWDGSTWSQVCGPIAGNVTALQVIGPTLYVGGQFQNGGALVKADYMLACDMESGVPTAMVDTDGDGTGGINGLARDDAGRLYIAGGFINWDQNLASDNVAMYDGSWHAMGSGPSAGQGAVDTFARSIGSDGTNIYVGTDAVNVAGIANADHVARWDGAWHAMGANAAGTNGWFPDASIYAITMAGANVVVAGAFQNADGDATADNVATFENGAWKPLGSDGAGNGPWIGNGLALAYFGSQVVAGGNFTSAGGDTQAAFVARYGTVAQATPTPTPEPTPTPTPEPVPIPSGGGRLPPAPTVTLIAPATGQFFPHAEQVLVSGKVVAPGGLANFCVVANSNAIPPGAYCNDTAQVKPDGTFTNLSMAASAGPGSNVVHAYARDANGLVGEASRTIDLPNVNVLDLRAKSMEVTQGVQPFGMPLNSGLPFVYSGVRLVKSATTVVRLYANAFATGRAAGLTIPNVPALLQGTRGGVALPGSPLSPDSGPKTLEKGNLPVELEEIAEPRSGYTFTLPLSWTTGTPITLRGIVNPQTSASSIPETSLTNNQFTYTGIGFEQRGSLLISPVRITYFDPLNKRTETAGDPAAAFDMARMVTPLGDGQMVILPYRGVIDATALFASTNNQPGEIDARFNGIFNLVAKWEGDHNEAGLTIGVMRGHASGAGRGREAPVPIPNGFASWRLEPIAFVNEEKPLASVTHELWHTQNYFHAGHRCANGNSTDFPFVHWGPDDQGFIQGMGLDRHAGSGGAPGTYRRLIPGVTAGSPQAGKPAEYFDAMTYCSINNEGALWISTRTWDSFGGLLPLGLPNPPIDHRRALSAAGGKTLRVLSAVNGDGSGQIMQVEPGTGGAMPSDAGSPYHLIVRDPAGAVVSDTGVKPEATHIDTVPGHVGAQMVSEVPGEGAATVELVSGGAVIARKARSAHPPTVTLLSPAAGAKIGATGKVPVRWKAADADGDALQTTVSYSDDGGKSFKTLALGGFSGATTVPAELFGKASNGRIQVTVNDGFDDVSALSGRLRVAGGAPVVRILRPEPKARSVRADAALALFGEAFDDAGKAITAAGRLTWFDGSRRVGRGRSVTLMGLSAGSHRLALEARGANGSTGRATVVVKVLGVKPDLQVTAPKSVPRTARTVKLKVASAVPVLVRAGGRTFSVGRKARSISIRVKPGSKALALRLAVRGGGGKATYTVKIARK